MLFQISVLCSRSTINSNEAGSTTNNSLLIKLISTGLISQITTGSNSQISSCPARIRKQLLRLRQLPLKRHQPANYQQQYKLPIQPRYLRSNPHYPSRMLSMLPQRVIIPQQLHPLQPHLLKREVFEIAPSASRSRTPIPSQREPDIENFQRESACQQRDKIALCRQLAKWAVRTRVSC